MSTRRPARAITRIWELAMPGLIALEPAAMAVHLASREAHITPVGSRHFRPGPATAVRDRQSGQSLPTQLRVEGIGK